jgi:hypothetical protein
LHITEAIKTKSAIEILHFLRKSFSIIGLPQTLHTDNGREFVNGLVTDYLQRSGVKFVHGRPYTPTTQGKVERANRTLKMTIIKLVAQSKFKKTWFDVLYEATLALNTNPTACIKKSPYEHAFCMLPANEGSLEEFIKTVKVSQEEVETELREETTHDESTESVDENSQISEGTDTEYGHDETVKRIRDDSKLNYDLNRKKMKLQHDRLRKVRTFQVGDAVGILIPKEYALPDANKLPAVVLKVEIYDEERIYSVVRDQIRIENKYFQHEMSNLVGYQDCFDICAFRNVDEYLKIINLMIDEQKLPLMPLQTAYSQFIQKLHGEAEEDNANKIPEEMKTDASSVQELESQNLESTVNVILKDEKCVICQNQLEKVDICVICGGCGSKMHRKDECEYGVVQYAYRNTIYCSLSCYLKQENPEKQILAENYQTKQFLVEYRNGSTAHLKVKYVESLAQYAKMVGDWRKMHPKLGVYNEDDDEIQLLSVKELDNIKNGSHDLDANECCVCHEMLDVSNPHNCNGCKHRMHGHIICPKRHLIYVEDDVLYCHECKKI